MTKKITVHFTDKEYLEIVAAANHAGIPIDEYVVWAIAELVAKHHGLKDFPDV